MTTQGFADFAGQPLREESALGVAGAGVAWMDLAAVTADFGGRLGTGEEEVAARLVEACAFVSREQAAQSEVNTPIATSGRVVPVRRPPRYCRAAIVDAGDGVLLDVKGCGIEPGDTPVLPNSNGLLTLAEALHELAMAHLAGLALRNAGSATAVLPIYALIDLGFDATFGGLRPAEPAVVLVRRAEPRPQFQWGSADPGRDAAGRLMEIELTLRRYGLSASSCGAVRFVLARRGGALVATRDGRRIEVDDERLRKLARLTRFAGGELTIDGVNVQVTCGGRLLDFGRYRFRHSFVNALYSARDRDYENLRGLYLAHGDEGHEQPRPGLSLAALGDSDAWRGLMTANRPDIRDRLDRVMSRAAGTLAGS
jgi:hypothetical protein